MARSRYQTIFTISADDKQGLELLDDVRAFIGGGVAEQFGNAEVAEADEGEWQTDDGELRIDSDHRGIFGFFTLNWKRTNSWELRWRLATQGADVEVEVQVLGPDEDRRTAGPPGALYEMLERFTCRLQGDDLPYEAVRISRENADWYADSVVLSPTRRTPVVAISEQPNGESRERLQRALLFLRGIAAIVMTSEIDSPLINSKLGRLACSGGEVRVYRPGATRDDAQELHRKWRPSNVDWGEIRDECMHLLALTDGPRLYHEVREEIFRLWETEFEEVEDEADAVTNVRIAALESQLVEARGVATKAQTELEGIRHQLENVTRDRDEAEERYETRLAAARHESDSLNSENDALRKQLDQLSSLADKDAQRGALIENLRQQRDRLQQALDTSKDEVRSLEEQGRTIRALEQQVSEVERERDGLSISLREVTEERDTARTQITLVEDSATESSKHSRRKAEAEHRRELEKRDDQIEDLRWALSQKDDRIDYLERRTEELSVIAGTGNSDEEEPASLPDEEGSDSDVIDAAPKPKSVSEAVLFGQNLLGLRLLDSAFASAKESPYKYPDRLPKALEVLSEYAGIMEDGGRLGMAAEEWFQHKGLDYVAHESPQTMQQDGRDFTDDVCRKSVAMPEHIRFGKGGNRDPKDILRIHFLWCQKEKLLLIGHVGRHLDVATS